MSEGREEDLLRQLAEKDKEIQQLRAQKLVVLGRGDVIIARAREQGGGLENEEDVKGTPPGTPAKSLPAAVDVDHPDLILRIVVAHPSGARVLIEDLQNAIDEIEAQQQRVDYPYKLRKG